MNPSAPRNARPTSHGCPPSVSRTALALAVAGLFTLPSATAVAATINVVNGGCTLADAITAANTDRATRGCSAGRGADTIALPTSSTQTLRSVLPDIASAITILGNGGSVVRDATAPEFRIFTVRAGADLTLQDTTVSGGMVTGGVTYNYGGGGIQNDGRLTVVNCTVSGNSAEFGHGGGIRNRGTATLIDSTVSGNVASGGGGISNYGEASVLNLTSTVVANNHVGDRGGGINSMGTATVEASRVSDNTAHNGGGIFHTGILVINDSTVSGNTSVSDNSGGGIYSYGALTLNNSSVLFNLAGDGAGLEVRGTATLSNCLVSGNRAEEYEGYGGVGGGVISAATARLSIRNCTISENVATIGGGAAVFGVLSIADSTLTANRAESAGGGISTMYANTSLTRATLIRTIVSGNSAQQSGAELRSNGPRVPIIGDANNLFGHSALSNAQAFAGFTPGASDLRATSNGNARTALAGILDTTLRDNGGPTLTHALVAGSPAVDGAGSVCSPADQRGVARPQGAGCDIGAFEIGSGSPGLPRLEFSRLSETVSESSGVVAIGLRLSAASAQEVSVRLDYEGGSATRGTDFTGFSTANIPAGQTEFSVPVSVIDDRLDEPTEQIRLSLRTPTGAVLGSANARTLKITDDDPLPTLQFQASATSVLENGGTVNVRLRLSAASGRVVTVPIRYSGSATRDGDYSGPASIRIPAGQIEANLAVRIVNDATREGQETILLDLGMPTNAGPGTRTRHSIRIAASD